ncbi:uncharacterized protein EKO05_0007444 [Ascochyta rabiei]|uniref:Uncharacterized protein n=1 Tax=Didymella rabiei TaxID=5454 RepID=A0A163ECV1_DIDRA|nr:uncharacterized protein EKO05_0007444 [Ascochyta rabiei]KZM23639.1 hypothetical protein ST47_g5233 [Ascochyta rabiei]UPX17068.1 hypothetical protein EKO05_0007444 [Ascochyta rabiei]
MHSTFILSLLTSVVSAQLSSNNLEKHVGSLTLSSSFGPVKESYWTGYPHHRRTPFAVSPDGKSAYLAYLDASETGVHVQQVNPSTFAAVGDAVTVTGGKEAGGLVAHNDGFALLTNEAMPSGTSNAPPESTPVAVLYRYTSGKETFKTWLGGPSLSGDMGMLASPDINGDLAYSEASGMYGAYIVVTAYSGSAQGHFGDAIQYVNDNGTLEQIQGASSSWGCSHNTGIAFEGSDSVPFPSICSEDQGAIWLNTGGTGMQNNGVKISNENVTNGAGNEAMGGMSGSYSGLARFQGSDSYIFSWVSRGAKDLTTNDWMGAGYTHSVNRTVNRNVAIATMSDKKTLVGKQATSELVADGDSQINWITTGSADCSNAHVATFDKSNALVTWEEIAEPTCDYIAMGCRGAYTGSYFQLVADGKKVGEPVKATDVYVAGDMVTMADGRICWPYVDMKWTLDGQVQNAASVKKISFACMSNGAGSSAPLAPASASPASSAAGATSASTVKSSAAVKTPAAAERPHSFAENAESTGASIGIETPAASASTGAPEVPADSSLPTFEIVTSGATIMPPSTTVAATALPSIFYSAEYSASIPTELSSQIPAISTGKDQPAPSATVTLPASESFSPSDAPAFTESTDIPNPTIGPESSSTPCSSGIVPTETPEYPGENVPTGAQSTAVPVETPTPEIPSDAEGTPCSEEAGATATSAEAEVPTFTPLPTEIPYPTGNGSPSHGSGRPFPTGEWHNGGRPGFGWGRPRPSGWGAWPGHGGARPTGSFGPRPSAGTEPEKYDFGMGKASSTPCTLETRVRPTATGAAY